MGRSGGRSSRRSSSPRSPPSRSTAAGVPLMDRIVYQHMAELDDRHWWYRARRDIPRRLIRREAHLPAEARILEIGCGTGHNLPMLVGFGHVDAIEIDDEARGTFREAPRPQVMRSPLPSSPGSGRLRPDRRVRRDRAYRRRPCRAASIATKLKPGGKFLITVPAHPWMWTAHDVANHHQRRYSSGAAGG